MGTHVKSGELYAGVPAKKVKNLPKDVQLKKIADQYIMYSDWYR